MSACSSTQDIREKSVSNVFPAFAARMSIVIRERKRHRSLSKPESFAGAKRVKKRTSPVLDGLFFLRAFEILRSNSGCMRLSALGSNLLSDDTTLHQFMSRWDGQYVDIYRMNRVDDFLVCIRTL